jgi:hypothetical protein
MTKSKLEDDITKFSNSYNNVVEILECFIELKDYDLEKKVKELKSCLMEEIVELRKEMIAGFELGQIVESLIFLKQLSKNLNTSKDYINKVIDEILQHYKKQQGSSMIA